MPHSKLKIFLCLTVFLMFLSAPFFLDICPDGKAYAFSSRKGNSSRGTTSQSAAEGGGNTFGYKVENPQESPAPVPEPATWLLVGAGAAGLAAYKKRFGKK
jgi:hypothetical protein